MGETFWILLGIFWIILGSSQSGINILRADTVFIDHEITNGSLSFDENNFKLLNRQKNIRSVTLIKL